MFANIPKNNTNEPVATSGPSILRGASQGSVMPSGASPKKLS